MRSTRSMLVAPAPVIVSAELAPLIVTVPTFATAPVTTARLVPVTAAPLWMLNVPLLPLRTRLPKVPVLALVKVTLPVGTFVLPEDPAFWASFVLLGEPD